jgi:hypothetical protein
LAPWKLRSLEDCKPVSWSGQRLLFWAAFRVKILLIKVQTGERTFASWIGRIPASQVQDDISGELADLEFCCAIQHKVK